eukprot:scaffold2651_cov56-Attheya_sp.AAC.2
MSSFLGRQTSYSKTVICLLAFSNSTSPSRQFKSTVSSFHDCIIVPETLLMPLLTTLFISTSIIDTTNNEIGPHHAAATPVLPAFQCSREQVQLLVQ